MGEFTELMQRAREGDRDADQAAFELLYSDLRKIARARLAREGRQTLLDTTSLVNETYLRLAGAEGLRAPDRRAYLTYASRAMRSVVVDFARRSAAERRGGQMDRITLTTALSESLTSGEDEIIRVHEALEELASVSERMVRIVEMRYFAGLNFQQVAEALGINERTVRRDWEKARFLLAAALR